MDYAELCAAICVVVIGGALLLILFVIALDAWSTIRSATRRPEKKDRRK